MKGHNFNIQTYLDSRQSSERRSTHYSPSRDQGHYSASSKQSLIRTSHQHASLQRLAGSSQGLRSFHPEQPAPATFSIQNGRLVQNSSSHQLFKSSLGKYDSNSVKSSSALGHRPDQST